MTRPSLLGLAAGAIALVVDVAYVAILLAEDEGDELTFAYLIAIAIVAAVAGSFAGRAEIRATLLGIAAFVLIGIGILGIFSIGLPLIVAGGLAAIGSARAARRKTSKA